MLRLAMILLVSALLLGSATAQPTPSPRRIALVIGNSAYEAVTPLPNAAGDAAQVAAQLRRLNFEVVEKTDLDANELGAEIATFGIRLRTAGPEAVSFFYYSGHAAQDQSGINYLIPVDSSTRTPEALRSEATPLQTLFTDIAAANNPVNVVVLDACRNWYPDFPEREGVRLAGLRDLGMVGNVFVGLSTTPGSTTDDGLGEHSPYTTRLLEALRTRADQPLTMLFDDIQAEVSFDTDSALYPQSFNGLSRTRRWCLIDGPSCGEAALRPRAFVLTNAYLRGLDRDRLLTLTNQNVSFVDTLLSRRDLLAANGIDSLQRLSFFLGELKATTSSNFRNTTDEQLASIAGLAASMLLGPLSKEQLQYYSNYERLLNRLRAGRGGNGDEASGDGWRYRSRGLVGTTNRNNYQVASSWIGVDLVASPDLLSDPEISLAVAAASWNRHGKNALADSDNVAGLFRAPVAGEIEHRRRMIAEVREVLDPSQPPRP